MYTTLYALRGMDVRPGHRGEYNQGDRCSNNRTQPHTCRLLNSSTPDSLYFWELTVPIDCREIAEDGVDSP
jgi:hypothetical protein